MEVHTTLRIPARLFLQFPNDTRSGRFRSSPHIVGSRHDRPCMVFIVGEFRVGSIFDILPLLRTVIKFAKPIQLIPLVLRRHTIRPLGQEQPKVNNFLWLHAGCSCPVKLRCSANCYARLDGATVRPRDPMHLAVGPVKSYG